jgi:hypothetical protein
MSFFPPPPERPADTRDPNRKPLPRWVQRPEDELPARVPMSAVLLRGDDVVVVLADVEVFSDGCYFRMEWSLRRGTRNDAEWQQVSERFHGARYGRPERAAGTILRFGVELADGQRIVDVEGRLPWNADGDNPRPGHSLRFREEGGHGGDDSYTLRGGMWLWPLPPAGDLTIVSEWAAFDIPQSTFQVDATALRAAAALARPLWG